MTKAAYSEIADAARGMFEKAVSDLTIQKMTNLPSFGEGVSLASENAFNTQQNAKPDPGRTL